MTADVNVCFCCCDFIRFTCQLIDRLIGRFSQVVQGPRAFVSRPLPGPRQAGQLERPVGLPPGRGAGRRRGFLKTKRRRLVASRLSSLSVFIKRSRCLPASHRLHIWSCSRLQLNHDTTSASSDQMAANVLN